MIAHNFASFLFHFHLYVYLKFNTKTDLLSLVEICWIVCSVFLYVYHRSWCSSYKQVQSNKRHCLKSFCIIMLVRKMFQTWLIHHDHCQSRDDWWVEYDPTWPTCHMTASCNPYSFFRANIMSFDNWFYFDYKQNIS